MRQGWAKNSICFITAVVSSTSRTSDHLLVAWENHLCSQHCCISNEIKLGGISSHLKKMTPSYVTLPLSLSWEFISTPNTRCSNWGIHTPPPTPPPYTQRHTAQTHVIHTTSQKMGSSIINETNKQLNTQQRVCECVWINTLRRPVVNSEYSPGADILITKGAVTSGARAHENISEPLTPGVIGATPNPLMFKCQQEAHIQIHV